MRFSPSNRLLLSSLAAVLLSACTNAAGAPLAAFPEASETTKTGSTAEIIAAIQAFPSAVIAAGDGRIIAASTGQVIAAGPGQIIAAGGGNVIAAGGNVIAAGGTEGAHSLAAGGGGVMEDLATAKLVDGQKSQGFVSHGPGRVALHVTLKQDSPIGLVILHFDPRVPLPGYHVFSLLDAEGKALETYLVRHGRLELNERVVTVPLGGKQAAAGFRVVGPEGASLGLLEVEAYGEGQQNLAAGATIALKTRAEF